jgi:hypothetical protein
MSSSLCFYLQYCLIRFSMRQELNGEHSNEQEKTINCIACLDGTDCM